MMNTRNILFTIALAANIAAATAQDVTILHLKDGTTRRYTNGKAEGTSISFYEFEPGNTVKAAATTTHDNGYTTEWAVSDAWKNADGRYTVLLFWQDNMPGNFQAMHGVVMGTESGLSLEQCDYKAYVEDEDLNYSLNRWSVKEVSGHYMLIGPYTAQHTSWVSYMSDGCEYQKNMTVSTTTKNIIEADLQPGQTYYYRTFAEGVAEEHGQQQTKVFYGEERSFRVPVVMADNGYYSYIRATDEAVAAFAANFPEGVTAPTWQQMEGLWNLWRATDEGSQVDLTADIATAKFDDGTGYRLNRIPQQFYTWMIQREVVIDAVEGLASIDKTINNNGESVYVATADTIYNVDSQWGVPGGKYIRFEPTTTRQLLVNYSSSEVVPGVRYKLALNFAPETVMENTDETASYFLPTLIRVTATTGNSSNILFNKQEVSATEVTTLQYEDFSTSAMGLSLKYETRVTQTQVNKGLYNVIMRVAEVRLTPITE